MTHRFSKSTIIALVGQFFDDTARIADCYYVGWDVFGHDRACTNGYDVSDGNQFSPLVAGHVFYNRLSLEIINFL